MPKLSDLNWSAWLYGLLWGFISGGAGAIVSGVAVTVIFPQDFGPASAKFWSLIGALFLSHGALSAAAYLKQSPLPALDKPEDDKASGRPVAADAAAHSGEL